MSCVRLRELKLSEFYLFLFFGGFDHFFNLVSRATRADNGFKTLRFPNQSLKMKFLKEHLFIVRLFKRCIVMILKILDCIYIMLQKEILSFLFLFELIKSSLLSLNEDYGCVPKSNISSYKL